MRRLLLPEGYLHGVLIERHGHVGAIPIRQYVVLIGYPTCEAPYVIEGTLIVGVEDVRPVTVHQDACFVMFVIHVASDMRSLLQHQNAHATALSQLASGNRTSEPAANDDGIIDRDINVFELAEVESHRDQLLRSSVERKGCLQIR
jgi:hypothetical protein